MRRYLLFPAALIGALAPHIAGLICGPTAQAETTADVVIGVDGTGSVTDPNSIVKVKAGPGALIVDYPGSIFPVGLYSYDVSVRKGIDATKLLIYRTLAHNPDATVHLIGHSQGARVAGDAIAELHAEGLDTSFIEADLYADPRTPGTGVEVALAWLRIPGATFSGERGPFGGAQVRQHCTPGDPVCDWPTTGVLNVPTLFVAHHGNY